MDRLFTFRECSECERLRAQYEQKLAMRLQAEADLLAAMHSRNSTVLETARNTIYGIILQWTRAEGALRQHEQSHLLSAAA